MRPRTLFIHIRLTYSSILKSHLHVLLHFCYIIHLYLSEILHEYPLLWTLLQIHPLLHILTQKIMNLLVVYLNKAAAN